MYYAALAIPSYLPYYAVLVSLARRDHLLGCRVSCSLTDHLLIRKGDPLPGWRGCLLTTCLYGKVIRYRDGVVVGYNNEKHYGGRRAMIEYAIWGHGVVVGYNNEKHADQQRLGLRL